MPSIKKLRRLKEKGVGSEESQRDLVLQLGQELLSEGRFGEALVEFEELEELSEETNYELHTFACRKVGETLEKLNNYDEAFTKIQKYYDLSLSDPIESQRALTTLGAHFLSKSEYQVYDLESQFTFDSPEIVDYLCKADDYCRRAEDSIQNILGPNVSNKEKEEMKSAIYANRFKIYYLRKRFESSDNFFHKAEKIMQLHKFWDRLISLYEIRSALEHKSGKLESALLYIDEAMKVTGSNSRKEFILRDKAIILVDLRSFNKAQNVLIEAYKSASRDFRDSFKSTLKCVCKILTILDQNENVDEVKKLEVLGDICVRVDAYHAALWYYDNAVNRLDPESEDDRVQLSGLYTSLAMTYKDLKMFDLASDFYLKELHLSKDVPEEAFKTLMALTITTELEGKSYKAVKSLFIEARSLAKNLGNVLKELHCLNELIQFNERRKEEDSDITRIKKEFEDLMNDNCLTPEDITEVVEEKNEEEDEDDSSDEFDIDDLIYKIECNNKRAKRKVSLKKDLKGETELHRKVKIPGNKNEIARLIDQSTYVDIEDNANFTPLHEACNHGQLEYVKMLVMAGADVNKVSDRGTSPLISAALNGYGDIIEYLLDEGAKPYHQDNDGWSCLDYFKEADIDPEDVNYKKLYSRLSRAIETKVASGLRLDPKREESSGLIVVCQDSDKEDDHSNMHSSINKQHASLRSMKVNEKITKYAERNSLITNELSQRNQKEKFSTKAANDYRKAIASLGCSGASSGSIINTASSSVMSKAEKIYSKNVITEKEYNFVNSLDKDEWLEEDITPKRKKIHTKGDEPISKKYRHSKDENNASFDRKKSVDKTVRSSHLQNSTLYKASSSSSSLNKPLSTPPVPHINSSFKQIHQSNKSNSILSSMKTLEVNRVKVKVYEKMFLIPIFNKNLSAEWLANEASKRYYSSTGQRLLLKLTTEDGAEIYPEDPLCSIVGPNMEQFIAVTTHLNSSISLEKFYAKRCKELNRNRHKPLLDALTSAIKTGAFYLPEKIPFDMDDLEPILETLNYGMSSKLKVLSIPFNHLSTLNFQSTFFSLTGLRELNLSKCELLGYDIKNSLPQLPSLKELNLSYNDLGDEALNQVLDQFSSVTTLNINKCGLSKDFELPSSIRDNLVKLSISENPLSRHGIEEIVRSLNPAVLQYIDVSYCGSFESIEGLLTLLSKGKSQDCALEFLDVSGLDLKGTICNSNVLDGFTNLKTLKLSGNMNITINSFRKLLEGLYIRNIPLETLEAVDIFSLFGDEDPDENSRLVKIFERLVSNRCLKCLKLHMEEEDYLDSLVHDLSKIWKDTHGPNSKVERKNQVLILE